MSAPLDLAHLPHPCGREPRYSFHKAQTPTGVGEFADERWLPIEGYEDLYEVSDFGRVRRVATKGRARRRSPIFIKPQMYQGYTRFLLAIGKHKRRFFGHYLVARAFIGPRPQGLQVAHLDGVRDHNRLPNLIYATPIENSSHRVEHGTQLLGEKHPKAKVTADDVREMRRLHASGVRRDALMQRYGLSRGGLDHILARRHWSHVA